MLMVPLAHHAHDVRDCTLVSVTWQQADVHSTTFCRYWARSFAGWHEFAHVAANAAHEAIARLQQRGWLGLCITQNVDRLHLKGGTGTEQLLELHGTTHR